MKKQIPILISILIAVAVLYITKEYYSASKDNDSTLTKIGQPVPEFQLTTLSGEEMNIKDLKGKVVLLNFFATWCPPCMAEMPHLQTDIWELHKNDDFILLAFGREHTKAELDSFNLKKGFDFPIIADTDRSIFSKFATQNIPRNVLLDKNGKIVYQAIGFEKEEFAELKHKIKELLHQ